MNTLKHGIEQFLVSDEGPTAVEYAVMLALIVVVCLTAIQAVGTDANNKFNAVQKHTHLIRLERLRPDLRRSGTQSRCPGWKQKKPAVRRL